MNKPQCCELAPLCLPSETGQGLTRLPCTKEAHSDEEMHESAEYSFMGWTVKLTWKAPKVGREPGGSGESSTPA